MSAIGFRYVMLFRYQRYIVFINLIDKNEEGEDLSHELILSLTNEKGNDLCSLEHKRFLSNFYNNNIPQRELLENRGVYVTIKLGKTQELSTRYIYNGDNTQIDVIGFGDIDKTPKIISFSEFMSGVEKSFIANGGNDDTIEIHLKYLTEFIY